MMIPIFYKLYKGYRLLEEIIYNITKNNTTKRIKLLILIFSDSIKVWLREKLKMVLSLINLKWVKHNQTSPHLQMCLKSQHNICKVSRCPRGHRKHIRRRVAIYQAKLLLKNNQEIGNCINIKIPYQIFKAKKVVIHLIHNPSKMIMIHLMIIILVSEGVRIFQMRKKKKLERLTTIQLSMIKNKMNRRSFLNLKRQSLQIMESRFKFLKLITKNSWRLRNLSKELNKLQ